LRGGTALNIVPHEACFDFEFRCLPGDDPDRLLREFTEYVRSVLEPEMRAIEPDAGFDIRPLSGIGALDTPPENEAVALVQELTGNTAIGKVSFGTEGSQFQRAGMATVVCGPGSIEQAHRPNEYVSVEQVAQCERFLRRLMERICQA
jgi:acetylornithine deacetylase